MVWGHNDAERPAEEARREALASAIPADQQPEEFTGSTAESSPGGQSLSQWQPPKLFIQITGPFPATADDPAPVPPWHFAWKEFYRDGPASSPAETGGGRDSPTLTVPAVERNKGFCPAGWYAEARLHESGRWLEFDFDPCIYAILLDKHYDGTSHYIDYSWVQVLPTNNPAGADPLTATGITWVITGRCGKRGCQPARHARNIDWPVVNRQDGGVTQDGDNSCSCTTGWPSSVPGSSLLQGRGSTITPAMGIRYSIVRLRPGPEGTYEFTEAPLEDLFHATTSSDSDGVVGYLRRWNQITQAGEDDIEFRLREAT